ncbi:unnamed protein product [Anthophora plagiata]
MEVHVCRFYLCLLLLVTINSSYQDVVFPEDSRLIEIAKGMFKKAEEKIDDTGKRLNSIFQPLWSQTTTTTTTEEPTTESLDINFRQLIDVPTRCPPNHNFIRGHCRRMLG